MKVALWILAASLMALLGAGVALLATGSDDGSSDLKDIVDEGLAHIEEFRGLSLNNPVPLTVLDDDDFSAATGTGAFDVPFADGRDLARQERALGFAAPDDLASLLQSDTDTNLLGLYEPFSQRIVVRDVSVDRELEWTIVHELVHAVQDQHFGPLFRANLGEDATLAMTTLIEGEAEWIAEAWARDQPPVDVVSEPFETELPLGIIVSGSLPYILGPIYVDTIARQDHAAIDEAHANPPASSSETMRPWRGQVDLPVLTGPPPDSDPYLSSDRGAALLMFAIAAVTGDDSAGWRAGEAWGADTYWVEELEGTTCVSWELAARPGFERQLDAAITLYATSLASARVDGSTLVSCDPGEDAALVPPADGLATFIRLSTALGMLHWIGPENDGECIVEELLRSGAVEDAWSLEDPQLHPEFASATDACAA